MLASRWHQGLYRRIAVGCVALVVVIFAVEAALFALVTQRWGKGSTTTDRMVRVGISRALVVDLIHDLATTPQLDFEEWLDRPSTARGRVFIVLKDGREYGPTPAGLGTDLVSHLRTMADTDPMPESWKRGGYSPTLLKSDGAIFGVLGVLPMSTWERFGPLFGGVGIALLGVGAVGIALMVGRPIRSRLNNLAHAAYQLQIGNLNARASEDGNDEVAEVARTFNGMADELIRRTTALETSDRLRRQLLSDVSHELMTPLTAVLGHLETLTMKDITLDEERRRKQLTVAAREAQRLKRVIGDLLDIARLEDGGLRLTIEDIETQDILGDVIERHEFECRARGIRVRSSVAAGAEVIEADHFRVEQALENLFTNALRHTPDRGEITLTAKPSAQGVVLAVSDSGPGIPEQHLPFVFDRFYKVSASSGIASRGSGLGLAIVKAIAHRHGGHVRADSAGQGTTVSIELPRSQRPAGERLETSVPPQMGLLHAT